MASPERMAHQLFRPGAGVIKNQRGLTADDGQLMDLDRIVPVGLQRCGYAFTKAELGCDDIIYPCGDMADSLAGDPTPAVTWQIAWQAT